MRLPDWLSVQDAAMILDGVNDRRKEQCCTCDPMLEVIPLTEIHCVNGLWVVHETLTVLIQHTNLCATVRRN